MQCSRVSLKLLKCSTKVACLKFLFIVFIFNAVRSLEQKHPNSSEHQETHVVMPELTRFIQSLHYAYLHSRKDSKSDLNAVVEKYVHDYLKQYSKYREFFLNSYKLNLDDKKAVYPAPKNKSHFDTCLRAYIYGCQAYQIPVSKAKKLIEGNRKHQQFSPVSDYEAPDDESNYTKRKAGKRNGSKCETVTAKKRKPSHPKDYDEDRLRKLINLIQCKKKNVDRESDTEDSRNKSTLKRKLENDTESPPKHIKISDSSATAYQNESTWFHTIVDFGKNVQIFPICFFASCDGNVLVSLPAVAGISLLQCNKQLS